MFFKVAKRIPMVDCCAPCQPPGFWEKQEHLLCLNANIEMPFYNKLQLELRPDRNVNVLRLTSSLCQGNLIHRWKLFLVIATRKQNILRRQISFFFGRLVEQECGPRCLYLKIILVSEPWRHSWIAFSSGNRRLLVDLAIYLACLPETDDAM